jgi:hypothetical protein
MKKHNKYHNKKCEYKGLKFDSLLERDRWIYLEDCQKDGIIHSLDRQIKIPLIVQGILICHYVADFQYNIAEHKIIEDCKGILTDVFRIKSKLFKAIYGYDIQIIKRENVTTLIPKK